MLALDSEAAWELPELAELLSLLELLWEAELLSPESAWDELVLWEELPELAEEDEADVLPEEPALDEDELLAFLKKRQGLLDGVAVTGGEPLLRPELPALLEKIKALGYAIKLSTTTVMVDLPAACVTSCPLAYQRRCSALAYLPLRLALKV